MNLETRQKECEEEKFTDEFRKCLYQEKKIKNNFEIVFLCIGTDRITGDCLGPFVGTKLEQQFKKCNISNLTIYGTLKKNVCYTDLQEILNKIKELHQNSCIIVIDAALSTQENIGKIFVKREKMLLGKGLHKNKIEIGDISIKAVVGKNYKLPKHNFSSLQNISLHLVIELAEIIAQGIIETIKYI